MPIVIHTGRGHFSLRAMSYSLLALIFLVGAMPSLLNVVVTGTSDGPAISLDICHPVQALDSAAALIPLAIPIRITYRVHSQGFGTPRPFLLHHVTLWIADIIPPPPK